jgi:glycine betaine/proline transport system permease protein
MFEFPEFLQLNIGGYIDSFVEWLTVTFGNFFDAFSNIIIWFLNNVESALLFLPWWLVLLIIFYFGWKLKNLSSGIIFAFLVFLIGTFGYWNYMMLTLAIVLTSVLISLLLGVPIGIFMARSSLANSIITPLLDAMQTMPSFVYLIPAIMLFPLGKVPAVFATIIYAVPPVIRLTNLGIRRVSKEMVEAAQSFGSSSWQLLVKIQLPQALPTIMTGINQTTMMALAMVVIASMVGAKGLGMEVLIAINRIEIGRGFEAGVSIVILAIIIDRISQGIANKFKYPE